MNQRPSLKVVVCMVVLGAGLFALTGAKEKAKSISQPGDFASSTIDLGIVCSDVERSVDFYTQAVGMTELAGFDVPAELGTNVGLTDNQPFHVHVLTLGKGDKVTKLKLMEFKKAPGKKAEQGFIHSTLGMRYTTIAVNDITAANLRMIAYGSMPLGKGLQETPDGRFLGVYRDPDQNFVELVGPKPKK
jgi:catechol 2,3-dioxygenase-like lactoylglutathione lyase family enzyme